MRTLTIITALLLSCGAAQADDFQIIRGTAMIRDGDTILLGPVEVRDSDSGMWLPSPVGGYHVRLEGIDAPEAGQQCTSADGTPWSCGAAATKYAAELAGGRMVECVVIGADASRRLLGTCSVHDEAGKPDAVSLNTRMVTAGLAVAYRQFSQAYVGAEDEAHAAKRGVWQGEFEMPWDYRARQKTK